MLNVIPPLCDTLPMTDQKLSRIDQSLIALRRILRATEFYARDLAHAARLTPAQLRILQIVDERRSTTPKALATQMGVSQATITTMVDRLVARGMVERARSVTDGRQTNVTITAEGHATLENAPDPLQQRYVRAFEALEDWEQAQLISSLERVASMLDAAAIDAAPVLTTGEIQGDKRPV
ncbi:MarR family winged helix-turn-helix transcriptional regulator [Acidimangrovimonas sediminis]|uniref:MarR family winged helix-turn-helix transcriptional regulator n=1 Tax=Acidimangrovimonas sediminis TaxID=2056283 RepID=UPI001E657C41|nr:MarR family transcriptional regulator [Acidimangrovimonas sediminis]